MNKVLTVVIPSYNVEAYLADTLESFISEEIMEDVEVLIVNDGSKDETWNIIEDLHAQDPLFLGLKLSRNKGHQNALLAGLMTAKEYADVTISMDADLQDDVHVIEKFMDKYYEGCDIVYGVRSSRKKDTFFKKFTAQSFYRLMMAMGVDIVYNHADCRLMSKRSLYDLEQFKEVNLFLRGIVPLIGYQSAVVTYERNERFAGESKYPLKKMLAFAMDGITSFSIKPIRMITTMGVFIFAVSIVMLIYSVVQHFLGNTVSGWSSTMVSIWAIGGLQILSMGVIGEYVGKIYMEAKARPKFIIEKFLKD